MSASKRVYVLHSQLRAVTASVSSVLMPSIIHSRVRYASVALLTTHARANSKRDNEMR